jgi:hypothetical protein
MERRITYAANNDSYESLFDIPISGSSSPSNSSCVEVSSEEQDQVEDDEEVSFSGQVMRVNTAPARPLTGAEEFRRSASFELLERAVTHSSYLILRSDQKYDLDSEDGQQACKDFLSYLERIQDAYKVST